MAETHDLDVTDQVIMGSIEDESLVITKCVCGQEFSPWDFIIHTDRGFLGNCPSCNRSLYFKLTVRVYEMKERQ
jgi:hypothetical protein